MEEKIEEKNEEISSDAIALSPDDSLAIAKRAVSILDSRKAKNIKLLHVENQTVLTDYFVLCTGNSNTQIKGYSDELEMRLKKSGVEPLSIEGHDGATWVAMDYGCVIIHIFNRELRNFYDLERLWSESKDVDISDIISED